MTSQVINDNIEVQVLQTILMNLVTVPEDIKITKSVDEQGVLLSVIVNPQDMGIIIGRNGSMAMSLKSVMRAVGKLHKKTLRLQFLEPDGRAMYGNSGYDENKPKSNFDNSRGGYNQDNSRPPKNYNPNYGQPKYYNPSNITQNMPQNPVGMLPQNSFASPVIAPMNPAPVNSSMPKDDLDEFMLN